MQRKRLFFDIETSFNIGIFWRSGYNQTINPDDIIHERAIICVCYKWENDPKVHYLTWDENQSDKELLEKFVKVMNKADEVVAHNGDKFDIRWLRTRCLYHNVPMFPKYQSIDTLKQARSLFMFNSNRLDYIAKFLGVGSKTEHEGMGLWKKIVLHKDPMAMNKMIEYCQNDVVILEQVFNRLNTYTKANLHYGVLNNQESYTCPECGGDHLKLSKTYTTSAGMLRRSMCCKTCRKKFSISNTTYKKYQTAKGL